VKESEIIKKWNNEHTRLLIKRKHALKRIDLALYYVFILPVKPVLDFLNKLLKKFI